MANHSWSVAFILGAFFFFQAFAIIAYDCKDQKTAHASYSLSELPNCSPEMQDIKKKTQTIQLLQPRATRSVPFISCSVEWRQTYFVCGRGSYLYIKPEHLSSGWENIPRSICQSMHRHRIFHTVNGHIVNNLKSNATVKAILTVAGTLDSEGNCENGELVLESGTLKGLIKREYEITLTDGTSFTDINSGISKFTKTTGCRLYEDHCNIADLGNVYVFPYIPRNCDEELLKFPYGRMALTSRSLWKWKTSPLIYL